MDKELELFTQAAENLEELKRQLIQQQGTSATLRALTASVSTVAEQVSAIPDGLRAVVDRADATEQRLQSAASSIRELLATVPRIVERMETSDYGQAVSRLLEHITHARSDLAHMRESATEIQTAARLVSDAAERAAQGAEEGVQQLAKAQSATTAEISAMREQLKVDLGKLTELALASATRGASAAAATATAYSQVTTVLKANAERQAVALQQVLSTMDSLRSVDVMAIRTQFVDFQAKLDLQTKQIAAISSKKGFLFG